MNRERIETVATHLAVLLIGVLVGLSTIGFADLFFDWDLLSGFTEKLAGFLIAALACALAGALAVSVALNMSLIARRTTAGDAPRGGQRRP